ncbi:MAG: hypothetical protein LN568_01670 [Rickettsia endosymbiont of Pseudomimeciton antennatum]|nr:hypothetical protein [Rickettsia endosymbiont of Pseudomimeciton antennatum]
MSKHGSESKPDSLPPLSAEEIKANLENPDYRLEHGIDNSQSNSLENLNTTLEEITKLLKVAEKEFKNIPQLKGLYKLQGEKAQSFFQEFQQGFDKVTEDIKKDVENRHATPLKDFADQKSAEQYEKSPIGRLEKFAKDQLKKVEKIFEGPANAIKDNKILNAVANVIKCSCKAVSTIVKSSLNNAIAMGDLAKSVVNLGSAIKDTAIGKGTQASMSK